MFGHQIESGRSRFGEEPVVIAMFAYASDARRALHALHEHHFAAEQLAAAFREPVAAPVVTEPGPRSSGKWFGQLRQIYRGDEGPPQRREAPPAGENPTGFEAMMAQVNLTAEETALFNRDLDRGAAIVTVRAGARNQEAQALLEQRGARIVHGRQPAPATAIGQSEEVVVDSAPFTPLPPPAPDRIQLFGEVLHVHKHKVSSGDVQVRKEAVTRMETVQVPVTREHLVVEHTDGAGSGNPDNTLRIPLSEERVYISKETVLREEYKAGKREVTQNESVNDTVRRERLLIDDASQDSTD